MRLRSGEFVRRFAADVHFLCLAVNGNVGSVLKAVLIVDQIAAGFNVRVLIGNDMDDAVTVEVGVLIGPADLLPGRVGRHFDLLFGKTLGRVMDAGRIQRQHGHSNDQSTRDRSDRDGNLLIAWRRAHEKTRLEILRGRSTV